MLLLELYKDLLVFLIIVVLPLPQVFYELAEGRVLFE